MKLAQVFASQVAGGFDVSALPRDLITFTAFKRKLKHACLTSTALSKTEPSPAYSFTALTLGETCNGCRDVTLKLWSA